MINIQHILNAIEDYAHLPQEKRTITNEQMDWFSEPEVPVSLLMAVCTAPGEVVESVGEAIIPWINVAVYELSRSTAKLPAKQKKEALTAVPGLISELSHEPGFQSQWAIYCLTALKHHQFDIDGIDITRLMGLSNEKGCPLPEGTELPSLDSLFDGVDISSGVECVRFFEDGGVAMLPPDLLSVLFDMLPSYPWGVDALMLLTQYFDETVAIIAAEALNQMENKQWQALTQKQLLTICIRFNRHPSLAPYYKKWQKHVMRYAQNACFAEIEQLHVTYIDGQSCATLLIKGRAGSADLQLNALLDFKCGIRETLYHHNLNSASFDEFLEQVSQQVIFTPVKPKWLETILPWILATQKQSSTSLDMYTLNWLSQMPVSWTEPAPFDLDELAGRFKVKISDEKIQNTRLSSWLVGNEMMETWLAPGELIELAKKPRDLLKSYYFASKDIFIERLSYCAAVEQFSARDCGDLVFGARGSAENYLCLAYALRDPNLNRKKFRLFEDLAEMSIELPPLEVL